MNKDLYMSPLEQFDIIYIMDFGVDILNIYYFFFVVLFLICFYWLSDKLYYPSVLQLSIENFIFFFKEMVFVQIGKKGLVYMPFICSLFVFILFFNIYGLLPFGYSITAHIIITFFFSFGFNFGLIILGFYKHGIYFFKLFIPTGVPGFLIMFIFLVEIMSYLIRTFSLSIRLFANIMAGHCLLYVFSSFIFYFFNMNIFLGSLSILFIYLFLFVLELGVCFLQAYVFVILLCIYINDSLNLVH